MIRLPRLDAGLPRVAGAATATVGVVNVISALAPAAHGRLRLLLAVATHAELAAARSIALSLGLGLLVAGLQLARGRRGALQGAVVALLAMGAVDLAKGLDVEEASLTWALAFGLWRTRRAFPVAAPRHVPASALVLGAAGLAALFAATSLPVSAAGAAVAVTGAIALGFGAARGLVARPVSADDLDRGGVASIVRAYGTDTLSAFKLRQDVQHRLHADSLVGQRVYGGTLLVAGDPVGDERDLEGALAGAQREAREHGLCFGVVGASERCAAAGRALGLRRLYLGDEAMVATGPMDLAGGARKSLRKAVNRVARDYGAELHLAGDLDDDTLRRLAAVSDGWRDGACERGFSMAGDVIADELLPDALVVLARAADGSVGGFLQFVPVFGRPQVSLGFMRRDRSTPNGMTDFLVVRAAELLGARGIEEFSLNFAAFGRWLRAPANPAERALARLLRVGDRWFQVERLERFTAKFGPRWQPRYLLFDGVTAMPRIALAALGVEGQIPALPAWRAAPAPAAVGV